MANGNGNGGKSQAQAAQSELQEAAGKNQAAAIPDVNIAEILAQLDAANQRLEAAEAKAVEAEKRAEEAEAARREAESLTGRRLNSENKPLYVKGGSYKFDVGPAIIDPVTQGAPNYPHLKRKVVETVDESEAIRWYCETNEMKPGSNRQLDREKINITCRCLEQSKRGSIITLKNRISALRVKVAAGSNLSAEDQELLQKYESEVFCFSNG